jgi:beta-lactamase class A
MSIKRWKYSIGVGVILAALAGAFFAGSNHAHNKDIHANDKRVATYKLLSNSILDDKQSDILLDFTNVRNEIKEYVDNNIGKDNASIYFQYLPTGTAFGYGETRTFTGASLIKVPYAMNLYKLAEQGKVDLDKKVALKEEWLNDQYGDLYKKGAGYMLSYREATRLAIENSDNTAVLMILDALQNANMPRAEEAINYLDIDFHLNQTDQVQIGAQSYNSILKCLYFSCYLKLDDSEEILGYMTESSFNDRLMAYIPEGVVAAHKIGTFNKEVQSDCGIFYITNRNYSVCIMLKQGDPEASQHIAVISKMIYDYVTSATAANPPQ